MKDQHAPTPGNPAVAITPHELNRFLSHAQQGNSLATVILLAMAHGLEKAAKGMPADADGLDDLKTGARMAQNAAALICHSAQSIQGAIDSTRGAFAKLGIELPDLAPDPNELMAKMRKEGTTPADLSEEYLETKNGLTAAVILSKDDQAAKAFAAEHGINLEGDEPTQFPLSDSDLRNALREMDEKKDKPEPPPPSQHKATPPTWTGRNGSKWNADGTRGDSTPNN